MHESFEKSHSVKIGSERSFGFIFAGVFLALATYGYFAKASPNAIYLAGVSVIFLGLAVIAPRLLKPLNLVWFKFGHLLHKIINPLIMGAIFFLVITPMAVIMRAMGKDHLHCQSA